MPATRKISIDQVHTLLAKIGLPVVDADADHEGFRARAWGGRSGERTVRAAQTVEVGYRLADGGNLTGRDLLDLPEIRTLFQLAVDMAPQYGYSIDWNPNIALMHVTRADSRGAAR